MIYGNQAYIIGPLILLHVNIYSTLKISVLIVPSPMIAGENVELICKYEMEGEKLYSVKWYKYDPVKGDMEFFRFVPNDTPKAQSLPVEGIKVDIYKSNAESVYLKRINLNSEGTYRCEVSGEAPEFKTADAQKEMKVYVLPHESPHILATKSKYQIGDLVNVTCISAKSKPAATLRWFINDEPAPSRFETEYPIEIHEDSLETSKKRLLFKVDDNYFRGGSMDLKCTAILPNDYTTSSFTTLENDRKPHSLMSHNNQGKHGSSSSNSYISMSKSMLLLTLACLMVQNIFTKDADTLQGYVYG